MIVVVWVVVMKVVDFHSLLLYHRSYRRHTLIMVDVDDFPDVYHPAVDKRMVDVVVDVVVAVVVIVVSECWYSYCD